MVKTEAQLWEAIEVAYSTSEVDYLKQCSSCGKMGHSSDSCRNRRASDKVADDKRAGKQCSHCKRSGHVEKDCWAKHGRPDKADGGTKAASDASKTAAKSAGSVTGGNNTPGNNRACFRCGKEGHMVRNCLDSSAPVSFVQRSNDSPFYVLPCVPSVDFRPSPRQLGNSPLGTVLSNEVDAQDVILGIDNLPLPLPLHFALAQSYV